MTEPPIERRQIHTQEALLAGLAAETHSLRETTAQLLDTKRQLLRRAALTQMERWVIRVFLALLVIFAWTNWYGIHTIRDCTSPGGSCYERGQKQTGRAVGSINTVTQVAVICADAYDGRTAIEACIHDRLRAIGLEK